MSVGESERGFRPGRWLIGRGWWCLPALVATTTALPRVFGARWYSDAPYYQAIATQMAREGTWWSPMQGDLPYFNKPPLAFWIHGLLVEAFGAADWAAHAPEGAAFVAACVLTAWLARRFHGPLVGVLAGCAMALTSEWIVRVSNFKLDSLHTVLLLAVLACWVRAFVHPRSEDASAGASAAARVPVAGDIWWGVFAGVFMGAALMTKPLFGLGAGVLAMIWLGGLGMLTRRRAGIVGLGLVVGAVIGAPWHVWMVTHHGGAFTSAYFHEQTVQRAIGEMHDAQAWDWYFRLIAGTIPESQGAERMWPIYGLAVVGLGVVVARWRGGESRSGDALAALWTLGWFVSMSMFGGKRNYYLMVIHPGTAWLAGIAAGAGVGWIARRWGERSVKRLVRGTAVAGLLATIGVLCATPMLIRKQAKGLATPERDGFMAFLRTRGERPVYDCGLTYRMASLAYIQSGVWPRAETERAITRPESVPSGALMAYRADTLASAAFGTYLDPRDRLVFRSSPGGQFVVYERH